MQADSSEEDADMIAQAYDSVMNKAVFILKKMSADEKKRGRMPA